MESPGASRGARIGWLRREGDESGPAAQELAEEVDAVLATLPAGAADGHQHGLGAGACPGAIAAPDLAQDDAEPIASSGRQLVASRPGNSRKVSRSSRWFHRC